MDKSHLNNIIFALLLALLCHITIAVDIQVAFMAPSSSNYGYNVSSTFPALAYALDKLNNDSILPDGYNLA